MAPNRAGAVLFDVFFMSGWHGTSGAMSAGGIRVCWGHPRVPLDLAAPSRLCHFKPRQLPPLGPWRLGRSHADAARGVICRGDITRPALPAARCGLRVHCLWMRGVGGFEVVS